MSELLLLSRLAQNNASDAFELFIIHHKLRIQRVELLGALEVVSSLFVVLKSLMAKGPSEVRVSILRVLSDNDVEVINGLLMRLNHLVSLGTLVNVPQLTGDVLDTFSERINGLFELL